MTQIRGIIFDVDGTLVDSNDAHAHAWVKSMAEQGYKVPFDEVRPLIGMGGDKVLPQTLGIAKETDEGKRISHAGKRSSTSTIYRISKPFPRHWNCLSVCMSEG